MKKLYLMLIGLLAILFSGCEDYSNSDLPSKNEIQPNSQYPAGFVHQYGVEHNEIVDFLRKELTHSDNHYQAAIEHNGRILVKKVYFDSSLSIIYRYLVLTGISQNDAFNETNTLRQLFSNANMFVEIDNEFYVKDISYEIRNILTTSVNMGLLSKNELNSIDSIVNSAENHDYGTAYNCIKSMDLSGFDPSQLKSPYIITSVAEYSEDYWAQSYPMYFSPLGLLDWFNGIATIVIDALGSTTGPITGALLSSLYNTGATSIKYLSEPTPCVCPVCLYYN